ncbi:MAG: YlxM family DNA-binding protein [Lachnospiraceae bacterium]
MEKIVKQGMLYDFYGELLTEHQKKIYEDAVYEDMSLSEIADEMKISRQGVHDLIKRCDKILMDYEDKLHLVEKFTQTKEKITAIHQIAEEMLCESTDMENVTRIRQLSHEILEEL